MSKTFIKPKSKYHIRSINTHLLDIYEGNYFIELGVIDINIIDRLLNHYKIALSSITYYDILTSGVGQISNDKIAETYYQINYLINSRQRSSTSSVFLTCGSMRYFNENHCEKYAPIVLIPIELNYQTKEIRCYQDPVINKLLLWNLLTASSIPIDHSKYVASIESIKLNSSKAIDHVCQLIANDLSLDFNIINFLTVCRVGYDDFTYDKSRFFIDRSMYAFGNKEIMNQYYHLVNGILPMNLIQKYACLKAHKGENFYVNGRLGTGKTRTIINIIGDAVIEKKKVLYVNQNIDAISDILYQLKALGFAPYIKNLTYAVADETPPHHEYIKIPTHISQEEIIDHIDSFEKGLTSKIHGFTYRYIMETLAILKNTNPKITKMTIEESLESYEVFNIHQNLQDIEHLLVNIDPYKDNLWKNLQITQNNITINELIERTNDLYNHQVNINQYINSLCKTYKLKLPTNITDLYRLTTHFTSFLTITPLLIWKDSKVRLQAKEAIHDIQILSTTFNNMNNYYTDNVVVSYKPGRASVILSLICSDHLQKAGESGELPTEDEVYINRLLAPDALLNVISDEIVANVEVIKNLTNEIESIFQIEEITPVIHSFLVSLLIFLEKNPLSKKWVKEYLSYPKEFMTKAIKVTTLLDLLNKQREIFLPYIEYYDNDLWYKNLSQLVKEKKNEKVLRKYLSPIKTKKNKKGANDAINALNEYAKIGSNICELIDNTDFDNDVELETIWDTFINFYHFIEKTSNNELLLFKRLLKQYISIESLSIKQVITTLKQYIDESNHSDSICNQLKNFKIEIKDINLIERCYRLLEWKEYLNVVSELKKELRSTFLPKIKVNYNNLIELVANDKTYLDTINSLNKKEKAYKKVLGSYYQGFLTNTIDVYQTIEHFNDFVERLENINDLDRLLEPKKFSQLLATINPLTNLYNDWFSKFRAFSICFKKGQSALQLNSILDNVILLQQFVNKIDQIKHIVFINNSIENFLHYHLEQLANDVQDDILVKGIADRYLYSVLIDNQKEMLDKYPFLSEFATTMESLKLFNINEANYCEDNLIKIRDNAIIKKDNKPKKIQNTYFNDYDEIVNSCDNTIQIYLADLHIFNNNLSLQKFDLVLIDDAHLSSANEYSRLNETKQVIVFGDSSFQTSVTNNLMQRINTKFMLTYSYRYLELTNYFNNTWSNRNCYFYAPHHKIDCSSVYSFNDMAKEIGKNYQKNKDKQINVLVMKEQTSRSIYTSLVNYFQPNTNSADIIDILTKKIRIIRAPLEAASYVNDVYVYYDDFHELDAYTRNLMFKNYVVVAKNIHIYYLASRINKENIKMEKEINSLVGKSTIDTFPKEGIAKILIDKLKEKGIKAEPGFGIFDCYIKTPSSAPNYAIAIEGKYYGSIYSMIDDYNYYFQEYQKHHWMVRVIYAQDLIEHLDEIVTNICEDLGASNENK